MVNYSTLSKSIEMTYQEGRFEVVSHARELQLIGTGRSAFVFRIIGTDKVLKRFFPTHNLASEEGGIYEQLSGIPVYARHFHTGSDFIVIEYIEGTTLFDCLVTGTLIPSRAIESVDQALDEARDRGLNPSDIHLRNIILTPDQKTRIIDVARFRQVDPCTQWDDLKQAYRLLYSKAFFPKRLSEPFLNWIADLYKGRLFESMKMTG